MIKKLLLLLCLATPLFAQHITGAGTVGNPYILYNAADFDSIRYLGVASPGKHYQLGNDIDMSSINPFTPFVDQSYINLNGGGYTLSNLTMSAPGLFPEALLTNISNITVSKCTLTVVKTVANDFSNLNISVFGHGYTPSAGYSGTFNKIKIDSSHISFTSAVNMSALGPANIGFLRPNIANTTLSQCGVSNSSIDVTLIGNLVNSLVVAGGICGNVATRGNIDECYVKNFTITMNYNTSGNTTPQVGGITGYMFNSAAGNRIRNCYVQNFTLVDNSSTMLFAGGLTNAVYNGAFTTNVSLNYVSNITLPLTDSTALIMRTQAEPATDMSTVFGDTSSSNIKLLVKTDAGTPPVAKTTAEMQDSAIYLAAGWDLEYRYLGDVDTVAIWNQHTSVNNMYPYLYWEHLPVIFVEFTILSPTPGQTYYSKDTVSIEWTSIASDSVIIQYTDDNEFSWNTLDTVSNDGSEIYKWFFPTSGSYKIKLIDVSSLTEEISGTFFIDASRNIEILSPVDSTGLILNGSFDVDIVVETMNIDQFTLFYAVGDTSNWILIALDIPTNGALDTITYVWDVPSSGVFGVVFLKASEISDTTLTDFEGTGFYIGNTLQSQPQVCWYNIPGLDVQHRSPIQHNRWVDNSCGWAIQNQFRTWAAINNDATGYVYYIDNDYSELNTVIEAGYTYQYTLVDTTAIGFGSFYPSADVGDSILYKQRKYYIENDSLWCTDELNNIQDILILDLVPFIGSGSGLATSFYTFSIYNVQRDTLINNYYPSNQDYEALNNPLFDPLVLLMGDHYLRGTTVVGTKALPSPQSLIYVEDVVTMFEDLSVRRDYFRGIDPKARKQGR